MNATIDHPCSFKDIRVRVLEGEYPVNMNGEARLMGSPSVETPMSITPPVYECKIHGFKGNWLKMLEHLANT